MGAEQHSKTVRERHYSSHFLRTGDESSYKALLNRIAERWGLKQTTRLQTSSGIKYSLGFRPCKTSFPPLSNKNRDLVKREIRFRFVSQGNVSFFNANIASLETEPNNSSNCLRNLFGNSHFLFHLPLQHRKGKVRPKNVKLFQTCLIFLCGTLKVFWKMSPLLFVHTMKVSEVSYGFCSVLCSTVERISSQE